jgi:hypothetical protein
MTGRGKAEKSAARSERLSVALRENLKRRKAQARGRSIGRALGEEARSDEANDNSRAPDLRRNPARKSQTDSSGL